MKQLFLAIFMLIPIWCYAQFNNNSTDVEKLDRVLNREFARQNPPTKKQGNTQPSSTPTKGTPTPRNKVGNKSGNIRTPGQGARKYNSEMDAFKKADAGKGGNNNTANRGFDAFGKQGATNNQNAFLVGGKTAAQHATGLLNGDPPEDVTVNLPIKKQYAIKKAIKEKADSIRKVRFREYSTQFRKAENKFKSSGYQVTEKQVAAYVASRMSGKKLDKAYPKDVVNEVDKAAVKYKAVQKCDSVILQMKSDLSKLDIECGGKCE